MLLEPRELGGRASQTRERERRRKAPAQLCDTLLELFETTAQFVLELLGGEIVETLHFALQRGDVALHELRGLLERVPLRERLANADDLLHRIDVVVVLAVGRRLDQALLGPVDELPRRHVADAGGFGGGQP